MTHRSAKKESTSKRLGEIFLEKGLINEVTLTRSLERSRNQKAKLGTLLENIGLITGDELSDALSSQYGFRVVRDFAKFRYTQELLQLVPADVANKHLIFPLKIDAGRLAIAMSDLTDISVSADIALNNNLILVPFVASVSDLRAAIEKHYPKAVAETRPEQQKPKTILLVDDDRLIYTILQNILVKKGYRVLLAQNGMEAYKMVLKDIPDVIITDKVMPLMDGYALQTALRGQPETKNIPMIMISSSNDSNEEANAFERGFFDYLSKPVREATLLVRVERAILFAENK
jgi:CheY-like chemotaxis protein